MLPYRLLTKGSQLRLLRLNLALQLGSDLLFEIELVDNLFHTG